MVQVTLSAEETNILRTVLESYLSDLRMEIADTDAKDFRDGLKHREAVLKKIIEELPEQDT